MSYKGICEVKPYFWSPEIKVFILFFCFTIRITIPDVFSSKTIFFLPLAFPLRFFGCGFSFLFLRSRKGIIIYSKFTLTEILNREICLWARFPLNTFFLHRFLPISAVLKWQTAISAVKRVNWLILLGKFGIFRFFLFWFFGNFLLFLLFFRFLTFFNFYSSLNLFFEDFRDFLDFRGSQRGKIVFFKHEIWRILLWFHFECKI